MYCHTCKESSLKGQASAAGGHQFVDPHTYIFSWDKIKLHQKHRFESLEQFLSQATGKDDPQAAIDTLTKYFTSEESGSRSSFMVQIDRLVMDIKQRFLKLYSDASVGASGGLQNASDQPDG